MFEGFFQIEINLLSPKTSLTMQQPQTALLAPLFLFLHTARLLLLSNIAMTLENW